MSYPVLFSARRWTEFMNSEYFYSNDPMEFFKNNGDAILSDCISCLVTEERNGKFEVEIKYPMDGLNFDYIEDDAIIKVKARPNAEIIDEDDPYWSVNLGNLQLFVVYEVTKPIDGIVTLRARHISYILSGIPCRGWIEDDVHIDDALRKLKSMELGYVCVTHPFRFRSRFNDYKNMSIPPSSVRNKLLGLEGSILDTFGGEYLFDNFRVILYNEDKGSHISRGKDRGVVIEYGKNLQTLEQDRNCAEVYSGAYPFWYDKIFPDDTNPTLIELEDPVNGPLIEFGTSHEIDNYISIDLTSDVSENVKIEETDTKATATAKIRAQLAIQANAYIQSHNLEKPKVSLTLSFVQLSQFEWYTELPFLETIALCDTVRVVFLKLGIDVKTKIVKVVYNPLLDRVESVDIGTPRKTIVSKR